MKKILGIGVLGFVLSMHAAVDRLSGDREVFTVDCDGLACGDPHKPLTPIQEDLRDVNLEALLVAKQQGSVGEGTMVSVTRNPRETILNPQPDDSLLHAQSFVRLSWWRNLQQNYRHAYQATQEGRQPESISTQPVEEKVPTRGRHEVRWNNEPPLDFNKFHCFSCKQDPCWCLTCCCAAYFCCRWNLECWVNDDVE